MKIISANGITAIISLFILALLLIIVWQLDQGQRLQRIAIAPVLSVDVDMSGTSNRVGVFISNRGLGPAIVKSLSYSVDGNDYEVTAGEGLKDALRSLGLDEGWILWGRLGRNTPIAAGERFYLLSALTQNINADNVNEMKNSLRRLKISIQYESLSGDKFLEVEQWQ